MTEDLVMGLLLDSGLSPAERTDFGITSDDHYRAIRDAVDECIETQGMGPVLTALDQALGDGRRSRPSSGSMRRTGAALSFRRHWMPSPPRADGQIERGHAIQRRYSD